MKKFFLFFIFIFTLKAYSSDSIINYVSSYDDKFILEYACSFHSSEINVFNMVGELIYSKFNLSSGTFTEIIDLSLEPEGLYLFNVVCGPKKETKKIYKGEVPLSG